MEPSENAREENLRLRRTMRDLVALSTLPAVWVGLGTAGIARSLAEVLLNTLSLDFIYVRLTPHAGEGVLEVVRSQRSAVTVEAVRASLAPLLKADQTEPPATIPDPFGHGTLHVSVTRFGVSDDHGVLVAASRKPDFPTEQDRLLLGVGANQTAIVVQRRRAEEQVHEQREWLRVTLASIGDAVIATDTEGRVTFLNGVAQELTGWTSEEAQGIPLVAVFVILNEQTRQPVENPVERVLREGIVVGLANHTILIAKDGAERPIDDSAAPIRDAAGKMLGVVLIFRDVTEQRRAEHHRNVRLGVTHALSEAATAEDGAKGVLQSVCDSLAWDVGFFWTVNDAGTALVCTKSWHRDDVPANEFETASCSRTFEKGQGLPGRVWASGQPAWVTDIAQDGKFLRLAPAVQCGLNSAIACPVVVGDQILGVIEFFTKSIRQADADFLELVGTVAGSVGQFIERKTAEDELRRNEQELADFFENATIGLHWVGPDGTILRANRAELDMLGYRREEYVGRSIADFHADEAVICDILKRLQEGDKLTEYPARLKCKDGSLRDVLIDSSVLWRNGEFIHTRCFTRDVTERNRAEAKVQEQERRTRFVLESITDAFFGLDREWRFTYVNRQAELLLERSRNDLMGKSHWDEYADTIGTLVEHSYQRAVAENVTVTFENFYLPHDRWYEIRAYPSPEGLSIFFRDVSERKRAEIALRESEQRFRQLADAMSQIVWTAGPDGNIDYLNHRWTEFTGLPQRVGNEGWGQILHRDDARLANQRWSASLETGAPFEMEMRLLDRRHQSYRWHLIRTMPIHDESGKVARWFCTSTDIHEQKRAEESSRYLAEASAELAVVVDYESTLQKVANLAVPYFADWSAVDLADDDGTLRRLAVAHQNPDKIALVQELMREYPPDPQSPSGSLAVLRTGQPVIVGEITDDMLSQGARDERHLRLIRSLGLKSYICVPLVVSGNTLGVLTFATAESGRKYTEADLALAMDLAQRAAVAIENTQLYQALRETDRRKDEFLATLAHELRNPLAPIRNALQILKMPRVDAATVERSREMMERQVHHLVRLVDDLLDVSRVMRGKIELRKERIELATVVARAVETVQPLVDAQGHQLSVRMASDSLLLEGDPVRLAQVVGNLLTNAAKYTERNGRIWLTAERDGEMAVLRVRDNGIGIAPHMLPRIFELFVQVDHASTKAQGGLGIGLTLVKNLVEMHNGIVQARSEGLGQGCEFVVHLPLVAQAMDQDNGPEAGAQADQLPPRSGKRLLVVDDNKDAADSLAMLLRLQRHEVRVAYSGMAALEMTKTYTPDVVFLDIGMPGMDGYEAGRRIREQPGLGKIVLAALTGWGQQEDRRRTAEAGFDHHLVKPPEPHILEWLLAGEGQHSSRSKKGEPV
jgi:PAS domain S-box-containing protein